jgi:hypothetical protein
MPRGSKPGERRGGGRKGTPNRRKAALKAATKSAVDVIDEVLPDAFGGDAHALLMLVYKNPAYEISVRIDAAKAAIPYEKPRLSSVDTRSELTIKSPEQIERAQAIRAKLMQMLENEESRWHRQNVTSADDDGLSRTAAHRSPATAG